MQKLKRRSGWKRRERWRTAGGGERRHARTSSGAAGSQHGDHTQKCSATVEGAPVRSADEQVRARARARLRGGRARAHVGERKGASEGALNAVFNSCGQIWSSVRYYIYDT